MLICKCFRNCNRTWENLFSLLRSDFTHLPYFSIVTYRCIVYIVIIYFQNFIVLLCDKQYEITNKCTVVFYQTAFVLIDPSEALHSLNKYGRLMLPGEMVRVCTDKNLTHPVSTGKNLKSSIQLAWF